jgi:hypothetical protein
LYLSSQPIVEGRGKCDFVTEVNPYQIKVAAFFVSNHSE